MNKDVLTVEQVVAETKNHLRSNNFQSRQQGEKEITNFLTSKQLKKIAVRSRNDSDSSFSFYLEFSINGYVQENAIIRTSLKKH